MNANKLNKSFIDFTSSLLIIIYLCFGFIPNLQAVDKIAPQWLVMSITNGVTLAFYFLIKYILNKLF